MAGEDEARELVQAITDCHFDDCDDEEQAEVIDFATKRLADAFAAGRAAERKDVVEHLRIAPRAQGVLLSINSSQCIARLADDIEQGAHVPAGGEGEGDGDANQPLRVDVIGGRLVMSIGTRMLAGGATDWDPLMRISDHESFAKAVAFRLDDDGDDGDSDLVAAIQSAAAWVIESGHESVDLENEDDADAD